MERVAEGKLLLLTAQKSTKHTPTLSYGAIMRFVFICCVCCWIRGMRWNVIKYMQLRDAWAQSRSSHRLYVGLWLFGYTQLVNEQVKSARVSPADKIVFESKDTNLWQSKCAIYRTHVDCMFGGVPSSPVNTRALHHDSGKQVDVDG